LSASQTDLKGDENSTSLLHKFRLIVKVLTTTRFLHQASYTTSNLHIVGNPTGDPLMEF